MCKLIPHLIALALLFSALACTLEQGDERAIATEIGLPTAAPTAAPTPAPPEPTPQPPPQPATEYPLIIQSTGEKADYSASTQSQCTAEASVVLVVQADGRATLTTTGPDFADSINCAKPMDVTYILSGVADLASEAVEFQSCNNGGLTAIGAIGYTGGVLEGAVSCESPSGDKMTLTITP